MLKCTGIYPVRKSFASMVMEVLQSLISGYCLMQGDLLALEKHTQLLTN